MNSTSRKNLTNVINRYLIKYLKLSQTVKHIKINVEEFTDGMDQTVFTLYCRYLPLYVTNCKNLSRVVHIVIKLRAGRQISSGSTLGMRKRFIHSFSEDIRAALGLVFQGYRGLFHLG